jgi:ATP-dependent helicase/nuclease subunit B
VSHILKLRPREALDAPFDQRQFGTIVHHIMHHAAEEYDAQDLHHYLYALSNNIMAELTAHIPEAERQFHQRRLQRLIDTIGGLEQQRSGEITYILTEHRLSYQFTYKEQPLTIEARIDRIEYLQNQSVRLIDHKTGSLPKAIDVAHGKALQLLVTALLWHYHAATTTTPHITALEYWDISGKQKYADSIAHTIFPSKAIATLDTEYLRQIEAYLLQLLYYYAYDAQACFTWNMAYNFMDYNAHLARVGEW